MSNGERTPEPVARPGTDNPEFQVIDLSDELPTASARLEIVLTPVRMKLSVDTHRQWRRVLIPLIISIIGLIGGVIIGWVASSGTSHLVTSRALTVVGAVVAGAIGTSIGFFLSWRSNKQERIRLKDLEAALREQAQKSTLSSLDDRDQNSGSM
jgi:hypothetical protein